MSAVDDLDRGIDELPSGKFRWRAQIAKKPITKVFATREDARRVRDAILREVADGNVVPSNGTTIATLGAAFLRSRERNRAYADDKYRWNLRIATAPFAHVALQAVSRRDVLLWLDELRRATWTRQGSSTPKPLRHQTRKHFLNLLRRFFAWAIDHEYLSANPAHGIRVEREDGDEDDGYQPGWYLDPAEQRKLLEVADGQERSIIQFAMGTGLRLNEMNCLHLEDVHLDAEQPYVEVKYGSRDRKGERFRSTKGKKGERRSRIVPLFGLALDAIKTWLKILPRYAKVNPLKLVFPGPRGGCRTKAPTTWGKTKAKFGSIERIGSTPWWHLLRHTFASSLVAGWWGRRWSLEEVKTVLGHSTIKVTERYAHLAESVVHEVAAQAQAAWITKGSHGVVTIPKISRQKERLDSPSKPVVARSNRAGRAR